MCFVIVLDHSEHLRGAVPVHYYTFSREWNCKESICLYTVLIVQSGKTIRVGASDDSLVVEALLPMQDVVYV